MPTGRLMNLKSICLLGSFWFLGDSYFLYKLAKGVYKHAFARGISYRLPKYPVPGVIIEGFAHSGNAFFRGNIPRHFDSDTNSFHRTWAVKRALEHGLPTVVVIRDPLEVAKSWHYRSIGAGDGILPIWVVLCCWISYHRNLWKFHERLMIVTLDDLRDRYPDVRRRVLSYASVPMNMTPDLSYQNSFDGERFPVQLSLWADFLLRWARSIYRRYEWSNQFRTLGRATPRDRDLPFEYQEGNVVSRSDVPRGIQRLAD